MPPSCSQSQALIDGGQKQYTDLVLLVRVFNVFLLVLYHVLLLEHKYCRVILIRILLILIEIQCTLPPNLQCSVVLGWQRSICSPHPTPHPTPARFLLYIFIFSYISESTRIYHRILRACCTNRGQRQQGHFLRAAGIITSSPALNF